MREVALAVIFKDHKYLLQLRDNTTAIDYPNHWSFFGGEIAPGENPWQALQRELEEELEWRPEHRIFLYHCINSEIPCRLHFFAVPFNSNKQHLVLHEGQKMEWFALQELQHLNTLGFQVGKYLISTIRSATLRTAILNNGT